MEDQNISTPWKLGRRAALLSEYIIAIAATGLVTAVSLAIEPVTGHAAVALLYLLLVVALGMKLSRGPVLLVAASSALVWNFLFLPPRFAFAIDRLQDELIFAMLFVVAMAMGHLTSQLRLSEMAERRRQQRTAALYELVHQAGLAHDLDSGLRTAIALTESFFGVRATLLLRSLPGQTLAVEMHPASSFVLNEKEYTGAIWAFNHRTPAGRCTPNFPDSEGMHLPLQGGDATMGVLSILLPRGTIFDAAERELLETFAVLIGTILEKDHLLQGAKHAEILETSEQLQRALLQSVSHELKTPLSAIQAGIDALGREVGNGERSQTTFREVKQALRRLHRVINNLLHMTRIESGVVCPKLDWCDAGELVQAAIDLAGDAISDHSLVIEVDKNLLIVKVDQALLEQCLCNLLLNAASNSAPGTQIITRARVLDNRLMLSVLDEGKGILESDLPRVFQTFYRGNEASPGGTGLGLAIVDGFVRAHGGTVTVANRQPRGAEFVITIPVETLRSDVLESLA